MDAKSDLKNYLLQYKGLNLIRRAIFNSSNETFREICLNLSLRTCLENEYIALFKEVSSKMNEYKLEPQEKISQSIISDFK
jgi:hypothetical protein